MADQRQQVQGVIVQIFGEDYRIGGDPAQVKQVAEYVDGKMREIAEGHDGKLPNAQVAMLAAMDITSELFRVMQDRKAFTVKAHESIDRLNRLVEERATLSDGEAARVQPPADGIPPIAERMRGRQVRLPDPSSVV